MWGHSSTREDEEGAGCSLFARAASMAPWGCVPHLARHSSGQGQARTRSTVAAAEGETEKPHKYLE